MRKITSLEDQARGKVTIELNDGRRVCLDQREFDEIGFVGVADAYCGGANDTRRLDVVQGGHVVGSVPIYFDPDRPGRSFMYEPRLGDFRRDGDRIIAANGLGPGDLAAVDGFRRADGRHVDRDAFPRAAFKLMAEEARR